MQFEWPRSFKKRMNLDGQMKETEPQLTIGNWRKTNGVTVEEKKKKSNEMRSSCEKNAILSQIENVVIRKVFFLLKILVFGPVLHCCQVFYSY